MSSSSATEVVLFDVGGVLVQLGGIAAMRGWLGDAPVEQLWHAWLHSPAVRAFETGRTDPDTFAASVVAELGLRIAPREFLDSFIGWPHALFPGAHELIARIPAHYRRALLSNSNALHWTRVLEDFGLGKLFEHRFVSHLTGRIKPDREAFEHVIEVLQCEPGAVLFLDDNLLNVEAARSVGMRAAVAVGVNGAERVLLEAGIIPLAERT